MDLKEGSQYNIIEYNQINMQYDNESGGELTRAQTEYLDLVKPYVSIRLYLPCLTEDCLRTSKCMVSYISHRGVYSKVGFIWYRSWTFTSYFLSPGFPNPYS